MIAVSSSAFVSMGSRMLPSSAVLTSTTNRWSMMSSPQIVDLVRTTLALLRPPPRLTLSAWAEKHFVLADGSSARPGRFRLWPFQREILDAIGDPEIERVTVVKPTRVGYTKCLVAGIGATADLAPCAMILL